MNPIGLCAARFLKRRQHTKRKTIQKLQRNRVGRVVEDLGRNHQLRRIGAVAQALFESNAAIIGKGRDNAIRLLPLIMELQAGDALAVSHRVAGGVLIGVGIPG